MSYVSVQCLIVFSVLATLATAPGQAQEIFTATAVQGDGVALRSVPVVFVIDRYMSDAEHAAVVAALQEGPQALHTLLASSPDIGRIIVAEKTTPLKYVYRRPQSLSRIALLANEPLAPSKVASRFVRGLMVQQPFLETQPDVQAEDVVGEGHRIAGG
jgi:hypothetical protein